jgi:release factor glutamine methyltransferase
MITRGAFLKDMQSAFSAAGIGEARREARRLMALALGAPEVALLQNGGQTLRETELPLLRSLMARRLKGEPLSRLRGLREFWSLDFAIDSATLDPRPDSECLIESALGEIRSRYPDQPRGQGLNLLDLGTGSGCLLLALLFELPEACGLGVDISARALSKAAENARRLGLADRARFVAGSWCDAVTGGWQAIVSNPPYIMSSDIPDLAPEVRCFDPLVALDGGRDGLDAYRSILSALPERLLPGAFAALEVGYGQRLAVSALAAEQNLTLTRIGKDLGGRERCLVFQANRGPGGQKTVGIRKNPH